MCHFGNGSKVINLPVAWLYLTFIKDKDFTDLLESDAIKFEGGEVFLYHDQHG